MAIRGLILPGRGIKFVATGPIARAQGLLVNITIPTPPQPITVNLVEILGLTWETQLVELISLTDLGFTPSAITLNSVSQTFQIGSDNIIYVLAALSPYETKTYTMVP